MARVKKSKNKKKPIAAGSTHTKDTGGILNASVAATTRALREEQKQKVDG